MAKNPMRKWAPHTEWCYERQGLPLDVLRRLLKVTARTIADWDTGRRPIPHWVPKVLRLDRMEHVVRAAQMTGQEIIPLRGLVHLAPPAVNISVTAKAA